LGLARRVHDNSILNEKFQKHIAQNRTLSGTKQALDRRVPTRWNSDFDCLAAHLYFKRIIKKMTKHASNKLSAYRLSDEQWKLSEEVQQVLMASII